MIETWLNLIPRDPQPFSEFNTADSNEIVAPSPEIRNHLQELLIGSRLDQDFLSDIAEDLGWNHTKEMIEGLIPRKPNMRRGEFGEVLSIAILERHLEYEFPVPKLRFKLSSGQSLPATDALAFVLNRARTEIVQIVYVESKLRTSASYDAGVEGYKQLHEDNLTKIPSILTFVSQRLYEINHSLYPLFKDFLRSRRQDDNLEGFHLSLCYESPIWSEAVLDNIFDEGPELPNFSVHVIQINDLRNIADEIFDAIGIDEIIDD